MEEKRKYRFRYFFDYGADNPLWPDDTYTSGKFGYATLEGSPLSETMRKRAIELSKWFWDSLNWASPIDPGPWRQEECNRFRTAVRAFFQDLQTELGDDYELIYEQSEPDEDPELDEYLKDPRNFRRK